MIMKVMATMIVASSNKRWRLIAITLKGKWCIDLLHFTIILREVIITTSFFFIYVMTTSFFYIYAMATSFFYIYLMATSFFYIHVMATSFFYIYIKIYIDIYIDIYFNIYIDIYITFTNWRSVQSFYWTQFFLQMLVLKMVPCTAYVVHSAKHKLWSYRHW